METLLAAPSGTGGGPASQHRVPTSATSTCGTSWGTTLARTCPRCLCQWSWMSRGPGRHPHPHPPTPPERGPPPPPPPPPPPQRPPVTKPANRKLLILCCFCWVCCLGQVLVAAFAVSGYSSTYYRAGSKPFNPLLGETYECIREDKGFCFFSEQVRLLIKLFYTTLYLWNTVTLLSNPQRWVTTPPSLPATVSPKTSPSGKVG